MRVTLLIPLIQNKLTASFLIELIMHNHFLVMIYSSILLVLLSCPK